METRKRKMKQIIPIYFMLGFIILSLSGCISPPKAEFRPPEGFVFSNYKVPLMVDYDDTDINVRSGDACANAFHDILLTGMSFGWGNCDTDTATRSGGFYRVGAADYEYLSFCRVFGKTTVHVYEAPVSKK